MIRPGLFFLALFLSSSAALLAQVNVTQEIVAVDDALREAENQGNVDAAARILAEEFTWIGPTGMTWDRQARIGMIARGERQLGPTNRQEHTVRRFGDTVISTWRTADPSDNVWVTRVYVQRDGRWQLVHQHGSTIMQ
jgi:hypothetical protein